MTVLTPSSLRTVFWMVSAILFTSSGWSSLVSSLMTTTSASLTESTKSRWRSWKRFCITSSTATSVRSTCRIRNTARGTSVTKCSSLARTYTSPGRILSR